MKTDLEMLTMNPSVMNEALSSGKVVVPLAFMKQGCLDDFIALCLGTHGLLSTR